MKRTVGRIAISNNPKEILTLATKVYQKHKADGASSPLSNLDGIDWSAIGATIEPASALQSEVEVLKGRLEMIYRERDLYVSGLVEALRASRNLLKALNQKNPRRLSDWGFQIEDSVRQAKKPKTE